MLKVIRHITVLLKAATIFTTVVVRLAAISKVSLIAARRTCDYSGPRLVTFPKKILRDHLFVIQFLDRALPSIISNLLQSLIHPSSLSLLTNAQGVSIVNSSTTVVFYCLWPCHLSRVGIFGCISCKWVLQIIDRILMRIFQTYASSSRKNVIITVSDITWVSVLIDRATCIIIPLQGSRLVTIYTNSQIASWDPIFTLINH